MRVKAILGYLLALTVVLTINGCAGSPIRISMDSQEKLANEYYGNLINAWHFDKSVKAKEELRRRGLFTTEEWQLIDNREVSIGMREDAVYASWGYPYHTNTTRTSSGEEKQLVYPHGGSTQYVYISGGLVTATQN